MKRRSVMRIVSAIAVAVCVMLLAGCVKRVENGVTVKVISNTRVVPKIATLKIGAGIDHVRWLNQTTDGRTITFKDHRWPFMEPEADIVVAPGDTSAWFTFDSAKLDGHEFWYEFSSGVQPRQGEGPPDEPAISGQP